VIERKLCETPDGTYCPERATLALVGQKWVPHIIAELMRGTRRFNELAGLVGGCNSRTLRDRLEALETLGVVERTIVATMPPWVEYDLTRSGRELGTALEPLRSWGRAHLAAEGPVALDGVAAEHDGPEHSGPQRGSPAYGNVEYDTGRSPSRRAPSAGELPPPPAPHPAAVPASAPVSAAAAATLASLTVAATLAGPGVTVPVAR